MDDHPDVLLHELRLGERETFVRYYDLYRAPVYAFVRRLLHDADDAVAVTQEAFTSEYRRILLHDDGIALRARTYRAALDGCRRRLVEHEADRGASGGHEMAASEFGRRVVQALEMLPCASQAVLLLHDVDELRPAETATVLGVTEDAAGALLFRAREEFRGALEELSSGGRGSTCRLAEQAAAGAVGRSLSDDDMRRLHEHADYCRPCRRTMNAWGGGVVSLALFLAEVPLAHALETTPVFGTTIPIDSAPGVIVVAGLLPRAFALIGRSLTSRAAAYALAAACLALSVGFALHHSPGTQTFVMIPAATPSIPRLVQPATGSPRAPVSRSARAGATSTRSATHPVVATSTRAATLPVGALSPRAASGSPAPPESYADAGAPKVTPVAAVGGSAGGKPPTVGDAAVPGAEEPHVTTHDGGGKAGDKATKDRDDAVHRAHTERGSGGHAQSAKHAERGEERHARKVTKDHAETLHKADHQAEKRQARKKSRKNG